MLEVNVYIKLDFQNLPKKTLHCLTGFFNFKKMSFLNHFTGFHPLVKFFFGYVA